MPAPWFTCPPRCAVACPRSRDCLAHQGYCFPSLIVFSRGIPGNHSTQRGSASSEFFAMRLRSLNNRLCVCRCPETRGWPELLVLYWMMSPTTAGWTTGRILLVCPAALSCVRFPLRQVCRLAVGDSRHGSAQGESVTEAAVAVGYDSVSAFIEMFRKMLGTTPQMYFRSKQETVPKYAVRRI